MTIEETMESLDISGEEAVEISSLSASDFLDFARYGEIEVLEVIFASDYADRLSSRDENGISLLHMAAANGHLDCIELLLRRAEVLKGCLNCKNSEGNTPLHWAAMNGQASAVKCLTQSGADLSIENEAKRSAFDEAVAWEKFDVTAAIIEYLESKSADGEVDDQNQGEKTAIV